MAAIVQHGRRKGMPRSPQCDEPRPERTRQPKVALISVNEWTRIQDQLSGVNREREEADRRQEKREAKHQQSLATVKHWENTIEGQRLKRLENLKLKAIKDEEERLKLDEEEARFQAEERRKAIERAQTLLYYRTDRIKAFHSGLVLSEVLREREQQLKSKGIRKDLLKLQDQEYYKLLEEVREKSILADIEASKERAEAARNTREYQMEQAASKAIKKKEARKSRLEEQSAIEKEFEQWKEKELERERECMRRKKEFKCDLDKVIADKEEREEREKEIAKIEDEERRIFSEAKKNMVKQRKKKEAELFQQVQAHQERMQKQLQSVNETKASNEDDRIKQAVAEQEAKKKKEEDDKHEKYMNAMRDIYNHRIKMMADQRQHEKEKAELEQELLRQRVAQDAKFHTSQLQKQQKAAMEARDVQRFHQSQMEEKFKKEEIEMIEDHEDWQKNMDLMKVEEGQFQEYAKKIINEAKEKNAPTYPLVIAARAGPGGGRGNVLSGKGGLRPSYQTTDAQGTELPSYTITNDKLPLSWRVKNTKKRMGFTW